MVSRTEVASYLEPLNPAVNSLASSCHKVLDVKDCTSYVKTIYIGYEIKGQMYAALYAYADHLEVALALSEDHEDGTLIDATHLTLKTLPVAAVVKSPGDVKSLEVLAAEAAERVRSQSHDVERESDYFMKARRDRTKPAERRNTPRPRAAG